MNHAESREGVVVREAGAVDAGAIRVLLRELHGDAAEAATLPAVRQEARTFVAADGDDVVGVIVATFVDYGHEPYGMVEELVVAPGRRTAGTGAALLGQCRRWLAGLGAEVVFVSAVRDEVAEFYLAAGFQRCVGPWLWAG
ncbi:GNAT family N-acetyltransferase [Kribbella sp. NPDC054772]